MKCSPAEEWEFGERLSGRTNPMLRKLNGASGNCRMLPSLGYVVVRDVVLGCQSPGRGGIWVAHGASRGFRCNLAGQAPAGAKGLHRTRCEGRAPTRGVLFRPYRGWGGVGRTRHPGRAPRGYHLSSLWNYRIGSAGAGHDSRPQPRRAGTGLFSDVPPGQPDA